MSLPIIKVENLSHKYTVQWAIKNIDFQINESGIYGLLGSNGAGKSTIMNIVCGVLKPTNGEIFIKGINMREDPIEAKKYIGFLPQQPPLLPELNIQEYLEHCANLRRIPSNKVAEAVDEVLEKCTISNYRKRLIKNLSGGFQQRVGIAQAIIHKPDLVVLDEPTNGLDPNQTIEIRGLIKEIAKERTILISTHILSEVQVTCDHIKMIEEGKMVFSGTVGEFDNYIVPDTIFVSLAEAPALSELEKIPGVIQALHLEGSGYRVKFADAEEAIENIVKSSVTNNWKLNEIRVEKSSMDTIFAELSKK
ncbi:MAG: ABC transporter ATP-binding protein [Bacteroidales bacterium]